MELTEYSVPGSVPNRRLVDDLPLELERVARRAMENAQELPPKRFEHLIHTGAADVGNGCLGEAANEAQPKHR